MVWVTAGKMSSSSTPYLKLRGKLLLVSLALLVIPWAGYEYVQEMETFLKQSKQITLADRAQTVAMVMHSRRKLFEPTADISYSLDDQRNIYARKLKQAIQLDGYSEDWSDHLEHARNYAGTALIQGNTPYDEASLSFQHLFGKYRRYFYTLLIVKDDKLVYRNPNSLRLDQSDHLLITLQDPRGNTRRYILSTQAPGWVNAHLLPDDPNDFRPIRPEVRIKGEWQETAEGYNLELRIPQSMLGNKISFTIADIEDANNRDTRYLLSTSGSPSSKELGSILTPSPDIENILQGLNRGNSRIWVINRNRHVLALAGSLTNTSTNKQNQDEAPGFISSILDPVYRLLLKQPKQQFNDKLDGVSRLNGDDVISALKGQPAINWRRTIDEQAVILSASHPVWDDGEVIGAVVVEQTNNDIQSLQNNAIKNLLNLTLFVFLAATLFLIIFATRLSNRIRQLHQQTESAISPDGRVQGEIIASNSNDELGDLSRSFADMMSRLHEYTRYLETMASKLSHELRTPLAVVKSSLDNLELEDLPDSAKTYTHRASEGLNRLSNILTSINEATRLEQALQSSEREEFNIAALIAGCVEGYKLAYPTQEFIFTTDRDKTLLSGYPDRIAQLLDKLISNAKDFSAEGKAIEIELTHTDSNINIDVKNTGPTLPDTMQGQLFDSMVSLREGAKSNNHLGLGLFIVRLISEFHHGTATMKNLADNSGVVVSINLPR
ncbi:MAG: proteobacterial dedicated sortase system histidine kinase [Sulfuriflexus sp.]|nr:proteobacterial dedicated sortase system histidine kinase [Sulfuriflexus sp.]